MPIQTMSDFIQDEDIWNQLRASECRTVAKLTRMHNDRTTSRGCNRGEKEVRLVEGGESANLGIFHQFHQNLCVCSTLPSHIK